MDSGTACQGKGVWQTVPYSVQRRRISQSGISGNVQKVWYYHLAGLWHDGMFAGDQYKLWRLYERRFRRQADAQL